MTIKKEVNKLPKTKQRGDKKTAMTKQEMKNVRSVMGVSQVELSKMMNLSTQAIAGWEGGLKAPVNAHRRLTILLVAKAYLDGHLSKDGELTEEFVDSIMEVKKC